MSASWVTLFLLGGVINHTEQSWRYLLNKALLIWSFCQAAEHPRHPTLQTSDIWKSSPSKNISNNNRITALKSPVPTQQGGGPVSTRTRCSAALVFSIVLPTGTPSLFSQFPAIVLSAATRRRLLPGSGKRWDVKAAHFLFDQLRPQPVEEGCVDGVCVCVCVCVNTEAFAIWRAAFKSNWGFYCVQNFDFIPLF